MGLRRRCPSLGGTRHFLLPGAQLWRAGLDVWSYTGHGEVGAEVREAGASVREVVDSCVLREWCSSSGIVVAQHCVCVKAAEVEKATG